MAKKYTKNQIEWLRSNVENKTYSNLLELTEAFNDYFGENRSKSALYTKIGKDMGMKLDTGNPFSIKEKEWIKKNHRKYSLTEFHKKHNELFPERTKGALSEYMHREGLLSTYWSTEEDMWVCENYNKYDTIESLLKDYNALFDRHRNLKGFAKHCQKILKLKRHVPFTENEIEWIKTNVDNYTHCNLSVEFNKKFNRNTTTASIRTYCFKNGISKEIPERFSSNPIGSTISKRGYTYIKTNEIDYSDKKKNRASKTYRPLTRVIWEKHFGKVPEGCQIIFLDGDRTNYDISNLKLIPTSISAIMSKNGFWNIENSELKKTALMYSQLVHEMKHNSV